jgi:hypothetical protein
MRYATAAAFRQALDDRLKTEAMTTGLGITRLRKRVAFELFLRRLVAVAPDRWVLKGALALDFRFHTTTRPTRDMDLGASTTKTRRSRTSPPRRSSPSTTSSPSPPGEPTPSTTPTTSGRFGSHVTAELAGRVFDQFVVDVGFADSISWTPDAIETSDLLSFAGIERIRVPALPLPHHIAEKLHAYTRKYGASGRESTRPKDLVDMLLISRLERLDASALRNAIEVTFGQRGQQPLPANLPPPPSSWRAPYGRLATEVDVEPDLDKAFARPPPSFSIRSSPAAPTAHGTLSISAGPKR